MLFINVSWGSVPALYLISNRDSRRARDVVAIFAATVLKRAVRRQRDVAERVETDPEFF
jgi:hypothetical protein